MPSAQHPQLTVRVIQEVEAWDAIEHHWARLHDETPWASMPLDFRWLRTWWQVYGPIYGGDTEQDGLRIITIWRDTRLVGAAPLYLSRGPGKSGMRTLRMLSTGEAEHEETCAEYLDILTTPAEAADCARLIWDEVSRMSWDCLELLDVSKGSPLVDASDSSNAHENQWFERGSCPIADLSGGFESYLQKLSSNTRQQVRRLMRAGERVGVRFELATADQIDEVFEELIALHQSDWTARGEPGVFAAPRFVEFHRSLLHDWLPRGRAVLARLSVAGSPIVVLYGYVARQKFDFYQSGMTREKFDSLPSPGILAHVLLMRELAVSDRGVKAYDFLRGTSEYKQRLSTTSKPLVGLKVWRPTFTAMRHRLSGWLQHARSAGAGQAVS